jgi:hypothetical protein
MRSGTARGMIPAMAERLQISLDLELTEPIRGRASDSAGHEREFSGWLELSAVIEALCRQTLEPKSAPA